MRSITCALILLCASTAFAAGGVVVNGDLTLAKEPTDPFRVLYFSNNTSQYTGQPWSYNNLDLYFLGGNVGIHKFNPSTALDVNGTVTATGFSGDGSGLSNVSTTIPDGAVTDIKITGPISAAKLDLSGVQKKYAKVAVVAKSGGDYSDPGTALTPAEYLNWCGTPSATNPCLLKIMPGVYTMNMTGLPLIMRPYIDIEGSGEKMTTITSTLRDNIYPPEYATVYSSSNAELRFLTVTNTGNGVYNVGILNRGESPSLLHITVTTSGAGQNNYGIFNHNSVATMTSVTASASGAGSNYGIYSNSGSYVTMTNVNASASASTGNSYGIVNNSGSTGPMTNVTAIASSSSGSSYGFTNIGQYSLARIDHAVIKGATNTIHNADGATYIGNSKLDGGTVFNTGVTGEVRCAGVYDQNYKFYPDTCP